jgi:hypothetical protein
MTTATTANPPLVCPYCGAVPHQHIGQCPNVKKVEYYPDGTIASLSVVIVSSPRFYERNRAADFQGGNMTVTQPPKEPHMNQAAKAAFLAEILRTGEEYAGIILGKDGQPDYHLILLPGEITCATWEQAREFVAKAGGELPTRREQSLLFVNCKEQFQSAWYWSVQQHESNSDYAWGQDFLLGIQSRWYKYGYNRARAVRRVAI